ncbi:hypothetical protein BDA99DRAFT_518246 [Phascolomyces articulosus]|uniref:Uncharacterized protein n=1 Tax=Phascolomyces articulosus TaxID=60185 RepID=A0AAD5PD21_9FUNG|nr:hypothetical protein BDA99DRAFT_518246 [Phascolomyces articulosus]
MMMMMIILLLLNIKKSTRARIPLCEYARLLDPNGKKLFLITKRRWDECNKTYDAQIWRVNFGEKDALHNIFSLHTNSA